MGLYELEQTARNLTDDQITQLVNFAKFLESQNKPKLTPIDYREDGTPVYRKAGHYKGKIWMSDDFDEPLEEFKEYM